MLKEKSKILLIIFIAMLAIILFSNNISNASNINSEDNKVFTKNEIMGSLATTVNKYDGNYGTWYQFELDSAKALDLVTNTNKLNSLINGDYIYQNIYLKVDDDITKIVMNYHNDNKEQEVKTVIMNNVRYAEIPVGLIVKIDGKYHVCASGDGLGYIGNNHVATVKFFKDRETVSTTLLSFELPEGGDNLKTNTANIYLTSDTKKDYQLGGAGWGTGCGEHYDRVLAEGNCYINVGVNTNIGETLEFEPFGTLNYIGTKSEYGMMEYIYQAKIEDKTIFNKDRVMCSIASKKYNILTTAAFYFTGDLIKSENIKLDSNETKIKLEASSGVVPENTVLETKEIKEEKTLELVKESLKGISNKYITYDISLLNNNTKIQPNGNVKISIPIPTNFDASKLVVYRVSEDGTKTKYDVEVKDNYVIFETDHFSTYVLAETVKDTSTKQENTSIEIKQGEKDITPKTGRETKISNSIIAILIIAIMVVIKKITQ